MLEGTTQAGGGETKDDKLLYSKRNISIYDKGGIQLRYYYFPYGAKTIPWSDVAKLEEKELSLWNTKSWGMAMDFAVSYPFRIS